MTRSDVVDIIGRACRLPGAPNCAALWDVLAQERCTVSEIDQDRWAKARYFNPRQGERGKSYTFAAGVLDNVWGFDPGVFGLSPREAESMDPQQRVLLQVVWEALEDAGAPPSSLAGQSVGVFVGVSSTDLATRRSHDVGAADAYTMTGSTLSLVANRISYVFDWHGPSFSVDTACSSSLVALSQALDALQAGSIDTAVVGGVNMLLSPFPFLGFAAARMLAPDGRCRPFDANGQGYVRAEGAVALVLRRRDAGAIGVGRRYAEVVAGAVNSDGRTSGVSLPSAESQAALLEALYRKAAIDPNDLAFVEAHGTGTRVGDPAEAEAIGRVLGQRRCRPLPIGSIKSNIGHLEPAAGLAGVLKAILAFEHGMLPASLHFKTPNPTIPFEELNLAVAGRPVPLTRGATPFCAGVSAFGFGGTNAHVILREAQAKEAPRRASGRPAPNAGLLMLSAHCQEGLAALAAATRDLIQQDCGADADVQPLAAAVATQRESLPERLVISAANPSRAVEALDAFLAGQRTPSVTTGRAVSRAATVAFVYAGNGSQWAGMGRVAYQHNPIFRTRLEALSRRFTEIAGWSLTELLLADDLAERLASARISQPLLFAIQAALTDALMSQGVEPAYVVGHSVGEIAAAYASGALDETQALRVIAARSAGQELARGLGTMAALALPEADARQLIEDSGCSAVEVGAINSPKSVTLSGPRAEIERCAHLASARGLRVKVLDLEYPFHSALVDVARQPLLDDLQGLKPTASRIPLVSTVTGDILAGETLDAGYWWRNVRSPVRFGEAIKRVADLGARVFIEISPRAILQGYFAESLGELLQQSALIPSLGMADDPEHDPVQATTARALARGARIDVDRAFGPAPTTLRLPHYPWQNRSLDVAPSLEATTVLPTGAGLHRYLGWRERTGLSEWFSHLDTSLFPELGDHKIGGQVYVPGAVLAEMAVAAARDWLGEQRVEIYDFDILAPLVLAADHMREVRTSIDAGSRSLGIASRRRLSDEAWQMHVEARFGPATSPAAKQCDAGMGRPIAGFDAAAFYKMAQSLGLDYGPNFQRLESLAVAESREIVVGIVANTTHPRDGLILDPIALDVAFHGLLHHLLGSGDEHSSTPTRQAYVPIRFGRIVLHHPGRPVRFARVRLETPGITTARCDVLLLDADHQPVAELTDARFRSSTLLRTRPLAEIAYAMACEALPLPGFATTRNWPAPPALLAGAAELNPPEHQKDEEARLLLEAAARRVGVDSIGLLTVDGAIDPRSLVERGQLSSAARPMLLGLLGMLEAAGLANGDGRIWTLNAAAESLPPLDAIIQTVIGEHPEWWPDCALLAQAGAAWPALLADPQGQPAAAPYLPAVLEAFAVATPRSRGHVRRVLDVVALILDADETKEGQAKAPIRVLELGAGDGALTRPLARLLAARGGRLLAIDEEPRSIERLRAHVAGLGGVTVAEAASIDTAAQRNGPFDLIVSANGLHRFEAIENVLTMAARHAQEHAILVASCAPPDSFHDTVLGLTASWFQPRSAGATPTGPLLSAPEWRRCLMASGCRDVQSAGYAANGNALLIGAMAQGRAAQSSDAVPTADAATKIALVSSGPADSAFVEILAARLQATGHSLVAMAERSGRATGNGSKHHATTAADDWREVLTPAFNGTGRAPDIVYLCEPRPTEVEPAETLKHRLSELTAMVQALGERPFRLWIVAPGSMRDLVGAGTGCPVQAGVLAFARTVTNEVPAGDIRVVDCDAGLDLDQAAERLALLIDNPGVETEVVLRANDMVALRVARGLPEAISEGFVETRLDAARLELSRDPGRERLAWRRIARRAPGPGEVEIEIAATGLNFRDCMWSMGLLPEEALEDGFAGPTLGFECSGRIIGVGAGVERFEAGQAVTAFAPAAFASHVTVAADAVAPLPVDADLIAAATVPVPFITAYYALHHLARLEAGESVLIHGGAGGVGLAALQIAQWRGAKVIATAGAAEKRRLLTLLGADHVLDSRSLAFADDVMALTNGAGVDVVLNSLAGEAMEKSLGLVRPFGRFLELGKRDFYGHTKIGLRPFRRNVSYYGIDADQLLAQKSELARRLFAELTTHLQAGTFVPLPYRRFAATEVADAFRLMQQSGHIGKIIVTPPAPESVPIAPTHAPFAADPHGAHVVIGGLGGFGLATARWLVDRGARRIVLVSRGGRSIEDAEAALAGLRATGADVRIEAVDVAEAAALEAMLARIRAEGPVRGIIHAAMVLDDDLLSKLTPERIGRVLAPKVAGAAHLDRLTRADELQYFVLYSSVTVLIGNPGQAAYVAANGYLEGLARRRRAEGLSALAIGWGGITDTGYLARNAEVSRAIERRTGTGEFTAAEALGALGEMLACGHASPAVVTIAPMTWSAARDQLALLGKPLFADLLATETAGGAARAEKVDIAAEIAGLGEVEARDLICRHLSEEVARIFRMPVSDVSPTRSLAELGMDSLMGLELRLAVQQRLGADIPLAALAGNQTLSEIAAKIAGSLRGGETGDPSVASVTVDLAHQHGVDGIDAENLAPLLREIERRDAGLGA